MGHADETIYKVSTSEELGRYLVAARDLTPGDVVLTEPPLVFGPKAMLDAEATMPCVGCYKPVFTEVGERCARCGWPVCSGNCPGLTDPRHHGLECQILSMRPACVLDNMAEYYRLRSETTRVEQNLLCNYSGALGIPSDSEDARQITLSRSETLRDCLILYKLQIRPHVEYCSHLWIGAPGCQLNSFDAVQNRAVRIVHDPKLTGGLDPLSLRRDFNATLCVFYRLYRRKLTNCSIWCPLLHFIIAPLTIDREFIPTPWNRKGCGTVRIARCFLPRTLKLWNERDAEVFPTSYSMGFSKKHDALLPLRCVLLQSEPEKWRKLLEMQSHMECRPPGSDVYEEANEYIVEYLMNNFISKLDTNLKNKYLPEISSKLIHRICGIIDTNALEIRHPEGSELLALYTVTCIMEHSCIPNTKHTFNVNFKDKSNLFKITVKIVVPLSAEQHITTMYSHALWGTQARRQHLKDTKYFACKCQRCSDPTELGTYLSAMKCLGDGNRPCDGIHLPEDPLDDETDWACRKCPVKVKNSQINMIVLQMGEEVDNVQMMGGSVIILENLLCKLSTFLHPNHYHLYSIKHSLVQLYGRQPNYMSQEILDKKINMCKDLLKITKLLDPGNARLSLYYSVLTHELHSALVLKSKKVNSDGTLKSGDDIRLLLAEAKQAVEEAVRCLIDDANEISGKKLIKVIEQSRRDFERYCKDKNINI